MRRIIIFCICIIALFMFSGCKHIDINNQTYMDIKSYDVAVIKSQPSSGKNNTETKLIYSKFDLLLFQLKYDIKDETSIYNGDYFTDKALVVCIFSTSHMGSHFGVKSIKISEECLLVTFKNNETKESNYCDVLSECVCIIEVKKEEVDKSLKVITEYEQ
ncbi:MAG: hypothetical protein K5923_01455 [Clostridia bacterium]|nr:hypothetical protein [Clostridia bacterium]